MGVNKGRARPCENYSIALLTWQLFTWGQKPTPTPPTAGDGCYGWQGGTGDEFPFSWRFIYALIDEKRRNQRQSTNRQPPTTGRNSFDLISLPKPGDSLGSIHPHFFLKSSILTVTYTTSTLIYSYRDNIVCVRLFFLLRSSGSIDGEFFSSSHAEREREFTASSRTMQHRLPPAVIVFALATCICRSSTFAKPSTRGLQGKNVWFRIDTAARASTVSSERLHQIFSPAVDIL